MSVEQARGTRLLHYSQPTRPGIAKAQIRVECYRPQQKEIWDRMIAESRNGVFLFFREYMEYHSSRFDDCSLLIFDKNTLLAVLPANRYGDQVVSHGGLTFGGLISRDNLGASTMLAVLDALREWLLTHDVRTLLYKPVPHIYHRAPAEEDLYALFRSGARLVRRDLSSTLDMGYRLPLQHGRRTQRKRGKKLFEVKKSVDYAAFMDLVKTNLKERHNAEPTHTGEEIELLAGRFPRNISLYGAYRGSQMCAGVLVYENATVAHAQYIGGDDDAKREGALDCVFEELLERQYAHIRYFDWGISTEQAGRRLNSGLVQNKESYGARGVAYDLYQLDIA
jgi:hypothetical protein